MWHLFQKSLYYYQFKTNAYDENIPKVWKDCSWIILINTSYFEEMWKEMNGWLFTTL